MEKSNVLKVNKGAKIRNRYNQVPHLNSTLWKALTIVPFKIFKYLVTIGFTCDTSTLWHSNLNWRSLC